MDKYSSKKYFSKLVCIPSGMDLKEHIDALEKRKSAKESFTECMQYPIRIVEERFVQLTLNGRLVKFCEYTCEID